MTVRLSISSLAGIARTLVAVGTAERRLHVGDDSGGRPPQNGGVDVLTDGRGRRRRWRTGRGLRCRRCGGSRRCRGGGGGCGSHWFVARGRLQVHRCRVRRRHGDGRGSTCAIARTVVLEEPVPGRVDRLWVSEVLLVELVDKPLVGAELTGAGVLLLGGHPCALSLTGFWPLFVRLACQSRPVRRVAPSGVPVTLGVNEPPGRTVRKRCEIPPGCNGTRPPPSVRSPSRTSAYARVAPEASVGVTCPRRQPSGSHRWVPRCRSRRPAADSTPGRRWWSELDAGVRWMAGVGSAPYDSGSGLDVISTGLRRAAVLDIARVGRSARESQADRGRPTRVFRLRTRRYTVSSTTALDAARLRARAGNQRGRVGRNQRRTVRARRHRAALPAQWAFRAA